MKDKQITQLGAALFTLLLYCLYLPAASAADESYQDTIDELTNSKKEAVYNIQLNAPFTKEQSGIREEIDPETGGLQVYYSLFSLPGRAGQTTELAIVYQAAAAKAQEESAQTDGQDPVNILQDPTAYTQSQYNLGVGWSLYFPYVETPDGINKTNIYIHLADGSVSRADPASENGLEDHQLTDVRFESGAAEIDGVQSQYRLIYADGTVYHFDLDGYLLAKTDRFGNYVQYGWGTDGDVKAIQSITDNCGQQIQFTYSGSGVQIRFAGREYRLAREAGSDGQWMLKSIMDPLGRETVFDYYAYFMEFNFFPSTADPAENTYYLLREVRYPTDARTLYTYIIGKKWLYEKENGYIAYPKLNARYDAQGEQRTNYLIYTYDGEPDGYPAYKSADIPGSYRYTTAETDASGTQTKYFYNYEHDQYKTEKWVDNQLRYTAVREFNTQTRMPRRFIEQVYNAAGDCRTVYADTTFDSRGNVTSADRYAAYEQPGERIHQYAYNTAYNLCVYESYQKDADTLVEIRRELADGGRMVGAEALYENGRQVKRDVFTYDKYGNIAQKKLQTGPDQFRTTVYTYGPENSWRFPLAVTVKDVEDADGRRQDMKTQYAYDVYGNIVRQIDPDGNVQTYTYDILGRKTEERLEDGRARTTQYNDAQNSVYTTDASGTSLFYQYDGFGKLLRVEDKLGAATLLERTYDEKDRLLTETDANGAVQSYTYDGLDRYLQIINSQADGTVLQETKVAYDDAFREGGGIYTKMSVTTGKNMERRTTEYLFDYQGRRARESILGGEQSRSCWYSYDYAGNTVSGTDPAGRETRMAYDVFGNCVYTLSPDGTAQTYTYDYMGNQTSAENGAGEKSFMAYDSLGRNIRREISNGQDNRVYKTYYDSRGNAVKEVDAKGNKTEYTYNSRGFLTNTRQYADGAEGTETGYEYDGEGRMTKMEYGAIGREAERRTNTYVLDRFGRVTQQVDNLGEIEYTEYDGEGNIVKTTDRNGITTRYAYDGLNRIVLEENDKDGAKTYAYNAYGELASITAGETTTAYAYTAFGEVSGIQKPWTAEAYTYDVSGNVTSHIIRDSKIGEITHQYTYDEMNRQTGVVTPLGTETLTYDKAGRLLTKENSATGEKKQYVYNPDSTIRNVLTWKDGRIEFFEYYEYDLNGNRVYADQNGDITKYSYDGLNRLTREVYNDAKVTEYEFDGYNNIQKEYTLFAGVTDTKTYQYDVNNRLVFAADADQVYQYSYDDAGNLLQKTTGFGNRVSTEYYRYDGHNRLTEYVSEDTAAAYRYGPEGLRTEKTVDGETTRFVYADGDIVGEDCGAEYYKYYRGTELIGYTDQAGQRRCYRTDVHGDVRSLQDETGETVKEYRYNAYGKEEAGRINPAGANTAVYQWKQETENIRNPFRYTGEYYDEETGFTYLRNRYYDSSVGRFITEDPVRDGVNWYTYTGNAPTMNTDPWGLWESGDEYRSEGAQIYLHDYTEQWIAADQAYKNATTSAQRTAAQRMKDRAHEQAEDIRRLDAEGKVQGRKLDVPVYNQLDVPVYDFSDVVGTNLCWAACASMWISYLMEDTTDRTLMIAQSVENYSMSGDKIYNEARAWISLDQIKLPLSEPQISSGQQQYEKTILTINQIAKLIDQGMLFAALYGEYDDYNGDGKPDWSYGHWVLGVGYATAEGHAPLVVSNDPWGGVQRIETYNDFQCYADEDPKAKHARFWYHVAY